MSGVLKIRTTKEFGESTVSKILDLVENASSRKVQGRRTSSPSLPGSIPPRCAIGALALAVLPPLVRLLHGHCTACGATGSTGP